MAAGKFMFYDTWGKYEASGNINFMVSTGIRAALLKNSYTPGTHSHSVYAQISGHLATSSGSVINHLALAGRRISLSGNGNVKYLANNLSGFSAGGSSFKAKYLALFAGGSASLNSGIERPLMGFLDLETGASTGVEVTQLDVTWASGGIAKGKLNQ